MGLEREEVELLVGEPFLLMQERMGEPFFEVGEAARGDHPPSGEHRNHEEKKTELAAPHGGMLADEPRRSCNGAVTAGRRLHPGTRYILMLVHQGIPGVGFGQESAAGEALHLRARAAGPMLRM